MKTKVHYFSFFSRHPKEQKKPQVRKESTKPTQNGSSCHERKPTAPAEPEFSSASIWIAQKFPNFLVSVWKIPNLFPSLLLSRESIRVGIEGKTKIGGSGVLRGEENSLKCWLIKKVIKTWQSLLRASSTLGFRILTFSPKPGKSSLKSKYSEIQKYWKNALKFYARFVSILFGF